MDGHTPINRFLRVLSLYCIGGVVYALIEIMWRGYTHWSMVILGGLCFLLIGGINEHIEWEEPLWSQMLKGSIIITTLEFITGCIVNLALGWNVWDYSNMPFNILGQICLPFSILWFFVSLIAIVLDDYIRYYFFGEDKPHYKLF